MPGARSYERERQIALVAVAAASRLTRRLQTELVIEGTLEKSDASPVTIADYAVQALVVSQLRQAFPKDKFIAEESAAALQSDHALRRTVATAVSMSEDEVVRSVGACDFEGGTKERTWILDPIDGTRGFIAFRQFCIALALLDDGMIQIGVLGCPRLPLSGMLAPPDAPAGCIFHAIRGSGTYAIHDDALSDDKAFNDINNNKASLPPRFLGERVRVSGVVDPLWATFCESVETGHSSHELSARIAGILGVSTPPVRMDSMAKYGCLARGDATIFLRFPRAGYVENVWDSAPAAIIVEEAGGNVTDGRGRPLNFGLGRKMDNDDGIVATNGIIHDAVIDAVQRAMRERG